MTTLACLNGGVYRGDQLGQIEEDQGADVGNIWIRDFLPRQQNRNGPPESEAVDEQH